MLPLRAFLGFTFCFAGLQKLANPGFFQASNPGSIQMQLAGSVRLSPIRELISPLTHVAVLLGLVIALAELAIGLGTLVGLRQRTAAAGGVALSLMLFLTVSFHASPYYTGADIVFAFAWTPLLIAGAGPVLSADAAIAARERARQASQRPFQRAGAVEPGRREVTLTGTVTAVTAAAGLVLAGTAAGLGRLAGGVKDTTGTGQLSANESAPARTAPAPAPAGSHAPAASPSAHDTAAPGGSHPPGTAIGSAKDVPVGGAASFNDPRTGDPSIVIQPRAGKFVAFDAVCPHAGCTVQYDQSAARLVCPCHGSQFSAATGAVEVGPAATGLAPVSVAEGGNGQLYAT
jgi:thiosulfate dehydrogenase [quinone] large subunit